VKIALNLSLTDCDGVFGEEACGARLSGSGKDSFVVGGGHDGSRLLYCVAWIWISIVGAGVVLVVMCAWMVKVRERMPESLLLLRWQENQLSNVVLGRLVVEVAGEVRWWLLCVLVQYGVVRLVVVLL
jgi:hypothetical protein